VDPDVAATSTDAEPRNDLEGHETEFSPPVTESPPRSQPASSDGPSLTTPLANENKSPPFAEQEAYESQNTASSGSNYSQASGGEQVKAQPTETKSITQAEDLTTRALGVGLEPRRSMVSAVSSPSPGLPNPDHDGLSRTITRQSVSPAQQDSKTSHPAPSTTVDDATPPYSATVNTKEAEAAAERSLLAAEDPRQSLPAYQSPTRENAPPLSFSPPAIVAVADLSARRHEEDRGPPSRPFSFVDTNLDDNLHRHTVSKDSVHTWATGSSLSKELGLDMEQPVASPQVRSYHGSSNDPNLDQHPAFRASAEKALPSQIRNLPSSQGIGHRGSPSNVSNQQEQQYRIPGPYGHQFRSTKPVSTSIDVGHQPPLQPPPRSAPSVARQLEGDYPSVVGQRHRSSDLPTIPRPSTTEYASPGVGPPRSTKTSSSPATPRSAVAKLFRPRSNSRSHFSNEGNDDIQQRQFAEGNKQDWRGSMLSPGSWQDSERASSKLGSARANASRSPSALSFYQRSPDLQGQSGMQNEMQTKGKEQKPSKKLQRATTSQSPKKAEGKKKGGFLRLSGLFGKSGKGNLPPAKEQAVQRVATLQPGLNPPFPIASAPASSVPFQQNQPDWEGQGQVRDYNELRSNSFQGQAPPVGGYYAPISQAPDLIQHQTRPMPRDPESFIGGRRLSEQRAAEQARHLENLAALKKQNEGEKAYQPPQQPQFPSGIKPHSAPPSAQHFDRSQTQQPRTGSQRFPLDLRIDTSGRLNPHRRSQPVPVMGTMSVSDPKYRGRISSENPRSNVPRHSNSNPQRQSPYTEPTSQHSPYGYGTARGLRKDNLSHAIDLHKRSRSPRDGRRASSDSEEERTNAQDPANKLGTFSETHRSRSQRGESGEDDGQEKPWKIDLPIADEVPTRTAAERVLGIAAGGSQRVPLSSTARNSKVVPPAELPGSKAPGDTESDEEIVMCSTAYPGQEWMPDMTGYGHWDDHV
jgi:hypothetical protein